jgi:hypothetical protein
MTDVSCSPHTHAHLLDATVPPILRDCARCVANSFSLYKPEYTVSLDNAMQQHKTANVYRTNRLLLIQKKPLNVSYIICTAIFPGKSILLKRNNKVSIEVKVRKRVHQSHSQH